MNFPTSDIQHLAQMLLKVRAGDQIGANDTRRLEQIANVGHSEAPTPFVDPEHPNATRVGGV